ncbi:TetR/AcrR family transcriptional regulator [Spiractinospora alimapuensis]|uniref:TetR/AcrR family transcriptional regulator n=1 Tax=Spiractinospora alimapuensis TaxID=2820884 RepID=UPI001F211928|nr:TetR/AcrR family transcriptional regulator [Spiractinospora alimapuensis]
MVRMSAEERRESVIRAAVAEFARGGYEGTTTEAIARRVGVSQPYLYRLFRDKRTIFLAAAVRCVERTSQVLAEAAEDAAPEDAHMAMAAAYQSLVAEPDMLLMQMQIYVAVASAEAAGDHEFGAPIRAAWREWWSSMEAALGDDVQETTGFAAFGMLINTLVSLGFPTDDRVWAGFDAELWEGFRSRGD